jgi:mannonate dehydratase
VICYNLMPLLDWTRTDLAWRLPNGATCMRFDFFDFAAFDIHILKRPCAAAEFTDHIVEASERRFAEMSDEACKASAGDVAFGLPGAAETMTLADVRAHPAEYGTISAGALRGHLIDFLAEVAPLAQKLGMRLCCHPDDPPFPLLGLPRIMSTDADYRAVLDAVDLSANGVTFSTSAFGARADNDLPAMMQRLGSRVHFLHLRNVRPEGIALRDSFHEAEHLGGNTDLVAVIAAILMEERRRRTEGRRDWNIPFRPDHWQDILDDLGRKVQPGYPTIGRLKRVGRVAGHHDGAGSSAGDRGQPLSATSDLVIHGLKLVIVVLTTYHAFQKSARDDSPQCQNHTEDVGVDCDAKAGRGQPVRISAAIGVLVAKVNKWLACRAIEVAPGLVQRFSRPRRIQTRVTELLPL